LFSTEPQYISAWKKALASNGFEFDAALSASEAIERAQSGLPNIIVIDRIGAAPEALITA